MHTGQSSSKLTQTQEACCVCSFPQIIDKVAFSTVLLTAKIEIRYPYNVFHLIMSSSHMQDIARSYSHFSSLYYFILSFFSLMPGITQITGLKTSLHYKFTLPLHYKKTSEKVGHKCPMHINFSCFINRFLLSRVDFRTLRH